MKIPSVNILFKEALRTFLRFPFAIASAVVVSLTAVHIVDIHGDVPQRFFNIIMTGILGAVLFMSVSLYCERNNYSGLKKYIVRVIFLALLVGYYFYLPTEKEPPFIHIIRTVLLGIGFHMLVSFASYMKRGELNGFWQFNKSLLLRYLTAALYTGVLYAGLSLALLALDKLLGVDVDSEYYIKLWFVLVGVFNTWFFLAGIPEKFEELETSAAYPKGLKIFAQYILIPLITIYLVILYVYLVKIIVKWDWPVGWVSYLILSFAIAGTFSLLLVYPVREDIANRWIKIYTKWFYLAMFPLTILLFLAIWRRVSEYGITENRYFVLVMAFWLIGISIYFLVTKFKNIKVIPVSLCLIAVLCSFGPWGAFSISKHNQLNRFEKILVKNGILVNGKVHEATKTVSHEDVKNICSIVDYLSEIHGYQTLQPFFKENLDSMFKKDSIEKYRRTEKIVEMMGIKYLSRWERREGVENPDDNSAKTNFCYSTWYAENNNYVIKDYDYILFYNQHYFKKARPGTDTAEITSDSTSYELDGKDMFMIYSYMDNTISFKMDNAVLMDFELKPFIESFQKNNHYSYSETNLSAAEMTVEKENSRMKVKIYFSSINGTLAAKDSSEILTKVEKEISINEIKADILIKFIDTETAERKGK